MIIAVVIKLCGLVSYQTFFLSNQVHESLQQNSCFPCSLFFFHFFLSHHAEKGHDPVTNIPTSFFSYSQVTKCRLLCQESPHVFKLPTGWFCLTFCLFLIFFKPGRHFDGYVVVCFSGKWCYAWKTIQASDTFSASVLGQYEKLRKKQTFLDNYRKFPMFAVSSNFDCFCFPFGFPLNS